MRKAGEKEREFKKSLEVKPAQPVDGAGKEGRRNNLAWAAGCKASTITDGNWKEERV